MGAIVLSDIGDLAEDDVWPTDVVGGLIEDGWLTRDRPLFVYRPHPRPHPPMSATRGATRSNHSATWAAGGDSSTGFDVFRSWRLPEACLPDDEAVSSLVNTFRVVGACVEADDPMLIDPQSYLIGYRSGAVEPLPPGLVPSAARAG